MTIRKKRTTKIQAKPVAPLTSVKNQQTRAAIAGLNNLLTAQNILWGTLVGPVTVTSQEPKRRGKSGKAAAATRPRITGIVWSNGVIWGD